MRFSVVPANGVAQYDSNAIRVENVQRNQIGHIPRQMAAKLSSYMVRPIAPPVGLLVAH